MIVCFVVIFPRRSSWRTMYNRYGRKGIVACLLRLLVVCCPLLRAFVPPPSSLPRPPLLARRHDRPFHHSHNPKPPGELVAPPRALSSWSDFPRKLLAPCRDGGDEYSSSGAGMAACMLLAAIQPPKKINDLDMFIRLLLATVAGAAIGFERRWGTWSAVMII